MAYNTPYPPAAGDGQFKPGIGFHDPLQNPGYPPGPGYPMAPPMEGGGGYGYPGHQHQHPMQMPITNQPGSGGPGYPPYSQPPQMNQYGDHHHQQGYMGPQSPQGFQSVPLNVPPGLEYLTQIDRVYVKQKVELLEAFLGCETKNKYKIKNSQGQEIFTAKEDTDCCTRNVCGPYRPFDIKIKDTNDREVIHLSRSLACDSCWCPCWLQVLEVFSPPGQLAGTVEQEWSICNPKFVVKNSNGDVVLRIEGPTCTFSICGDVEFQILSKDGGTVVGKISKSWSGLLREAFTDADNFGINFPMDLDVRMKAVMVGACFLIDFMFFEKKGNEERDGLGMLG